MAHTMTSYQNSLRNENITSNAAAKSVDAPSVANREALSSIGNQLQQLDIKPQGAVKPETEGTRMVARDHPTPQFQQQATGHHHLQSTDQSEAVDERLAPTADAESFSEEEQNELNESLGQNESNENMSIVEAASPVPLPPGVHDIDIGDLDNPQLVSLYIKDIYAYLYFLEAEYPIKPEYLNSNKQITGRMRGVLVDWLFQVHLRFHLLQETMYLCISVMDRYLQDNVCTKSQLQLVGVTSLLLASKYEEMYAPELQDFVYITDSAYTKSQIIAMEQQILVALGFNFGRPLQLHFLRRFSKAWEVDAQKHTLAKYLMMVSQTDYSLVHVSPSRLAAAALCLSARLLSDTPWDAAMRHYTHYSEHQLKPVMCVLAQLAHSNYTGSAKHKAIRTFFSSNKHMHVSLLAELDSDSARLFADQTAQLPRPL